MSELWERLVRYLQGRSLRERWLLVVIACVLGVILMQALVIRPLRAELSSSLRETEGLEAEVRLAERRAREMLRLRVELASVESRVRSGENTNLFTMLESLAERAAIKERLESIKPKQASGIDRYPEKRVEVSIKGATLGQTVQYLYAIENAPVLLIVRSLRIKTRLDDPQLLDVSFSVSSFERA